MEFLNPDTETFRWVILPLLIFFSRIADQSLGTIRLIFLSKGFKFYAPLLGFFEVIIWLLAVTQILKHVDSAISYVAYGAGFAAGNFLGMWLEEKISIGKVIIRIIPKADTSQLLNYMKTQNMGITKVDASGSMGPVKIIFSVLNRKDLKHLIPAINQYNPHAFYSIEDVRAVREGIFKPSSRRTVFSFHSTTKKIK
jgi:uncharacterized protein YebE (UPF0316 family)